MTRAPGADIFRFMAANVARKTHKAFLIFLFAGQSHFIGIDHDDEITSIDMRRENRLFFSPEQLCRLHRDAAQHLVLRVNDPPLAGDFAGFGGKRFHGGGKGTEITGRAGTCQIFDRPSPTNSPAVVSKKRFRPTKMAAGYFEFASLIPSRYAERSRH